MSAPNFTFTPGIPQSSQAIDVTQKPIFNNFQAVAELLAINHVGFYDTTNFGKHTVTSLPIQGSAPATSATEMAIYAATSTDANGIEIYARYPSNGSIVQITGAGGTTSGAVASGSGFSYMPGNVILKWGNASGIVTGTNTIVFPTGGGLPAFASTIFFVQYSPSANYTQANVAYVTNITTTSFQLVAPAAISSTIFWMAMGI